MQTANTAVKFRQIPKVNILGVPFSTLSYQETVELIRTWMGQAKPRQVVTANPEIVMFARQNSDMFNVLQRADIITADGIGAVYGARILGQPIRERVTGADMLPPLFETANREKWPVYLLGASPESNGRALSTLMSMYPQIPFAGRDGFFIKEDMPVIIEDIRQHAPKLLLVGLGMGRQELFIAEHLEQLNVPVSIGIGGCIDIYAGTVKRAPLFWQKTQLEWLYRLLKQPSRWRRQLALPKFALAVLKQRLIGGQK